jgi:hypothetical protein
MSTPEAEVKTAAVTEVASLKSRVTALEVSAKTWYETHLPLLAGVAGLVIGLLVGHFVRL